MQGGGGTWPGGTPLRNRRARGGTLTLGSRCARGRRSGTRATTLASSGRCARPAGNGRALRGSMRRGSGGREGGVQAVPVVLRDRALGVEDVVRWETQRRLA